MVSPAHSRFRAAIVALLLAGPAIAHQELLFARVTSEPSSPVAGEPFALQVRLSDSSRRDVAGVELVARLYDSVTTEGAEAGSRGEAGAGGEAASGGEAPGEVEAAGGETAVAQASLGAQPGSALYRGVMPPQPAGRYRLQLVELVGGNAETSASGVLEVGGGEPLEMELVLPPSGQGGLGAWLVWLVGLPLLAGVLVTLLVLTGRQRSTSE